MKKLSFFFDIDNTLAIWPDGTIPDSAMYCIRTLQEAGHFVAIATGRLQIDAMRFARLAGIENVVSDGGCSVTIGNELKEMGGLPLDDCIAYVKELEEKGVPWGVITDNSFTRITPYEAIKRLNPPWDFYDTEVIPDYDYTTMPAVYKLFVYMTPEEEEAKKVSRMEPGLIRYDKNCAFYEPICKAVGIRRILELTNRQDSEVVVFGDGHNDISMFCDGWMKIAMGNANPKLKGMADYVTAPCDDDGIMQACRKFGWVP